MSLINPLTDNGYKFWSGIGNDLPIYLLGVLPLWWHQRKCHVSGCHRLGRYTLKHYKLCKRHHPLVPTKVTHLHIAKLHKGAILKKVD